MDHLLSPTSTWSVLGNVGCDECFDDADDDVP